ncbi:MAG: hypothetical protein PHF86_11400 [Candidatus Nanoarchaeia archaeon]|nr:hypothetical protein [Candidatus Nanoarchaeia archaeon]
MNKIIVLLLLTIFIAGCNNRTEGFGNEQFKSASPENQQEIPDISKLSNYAKFEGSVICDQLINEDIVGAEARAEKYAKRYGFTGLAEAQAYGKSVEDQTDLKTQISLEAEIICPKEMQMMKNLQINE